MACIGMAYIVMAYTVMAYIAVMHEMLHPQSVAPIARSPHNCCRLLRREPNLRVPHSQRARDDATARLAALAKLDDERETCQRWQRCRERARLACAWA